jgi:putative transposase
MLGQHVVDNRRLLAHSGGRWTSQSLRSDLAIDALEMDIGNCQRGGADLSAPTPYSDCGVQNLSVRYSERLAENQFLASVGSKGDSYEDAFAKGFNGL